MRRGEGVEGERESEEWKGRDSQVLEMGLRGMHTLVSAVGLRGATAQRWERPTCDVTTHTVVFVERK